MLSGRGRYWIVHLASLVDNEYKMAGVMNVSEGVTKEILREGSGPQVLKGDNITVQCTGSIAEGNKKFWRSVVTDFCLESMDQVSLKAQCWYIPEMRNSRIPEMHCKRCPFLGGTRIVHFWYTRNGHSLLCSYIILHFRQTLAVRKRS